MKVEFDMDRFWRRQKFNDMVYAIERMNDYEELERLNRVVVLRMRDVQGHDELNARISQTLGQETT